jgi:hypothetical protein|tara:strand:+ start:732 stop:1025 length:294 start_codon:yes stop_codon:yes gene_type:complete
MNKRDLIQRFATGQKGSNQHAQCVNNILTLYNTDIVKVDKSGITLNSGGWETVTTKSYINMALEALGSSWVLVQRDSIWYLMKNDNERIKFRDGMTI